MATNVRELVDRLDGEHLPNYSSDDLEAQPRCLKDGQMWPCDTRQLIEVVWHATHLVQSGR